MKNGLVWHERFEIGVDFIDEAHKKLFSIMNRLLRLCEQETTSKWSCQEGIKYLKGYAMKHFAEEEAYMRSIDYNGYSVHKRLHDNFRDKTLPALENELDVENYSVEAIRHFAAVCIGWLTGHILIEDQAIVGEVPSKWTKLAPEKELEALEQTIIQIVYDIFRLDTKVISEHYAGEDFGRAVFCRLRYSACQGESWEVVLVLEEKLILNTVSEMVKMKFSVVDDVAINVTRYITRQFMEHLMHFICVDDKLELEKEELLNHEQFKKLYEEEYPQFSLLFDTGEGYMAFYATTPHQSFRKIGVAIRTENAMTEVEKYLDRTEKTKKKILVVDDSNVIRHSMNRLLTPNYDVTMVESGVSAIKSIALDKPDLILLDYEMPVCDGRQTLAMIRAEKDMADIPVIFLTGRGDKESVMKVMSLEPAGYLLKSMKAKDIKKIIQNFFQNRP